MLQLLPAPTPPPEYCFLWVDRWWPFSDPWWACMQKGEWSGWAQAAGAVLALALAIGLQVKTRLDARRDAKDMATSYAAQIGVITDVIIIACEQQKWQDFKAGRHALADACSMASAVPFALLQGDALAGFMSLRALAIETHVKSEEHSAGGNWASWRGEFAEFRAQVLKAIKMINTAK